MADGWRCIDTGPYRASYNMALDEAIAREVRKGNAPPTVRLYGWEGPSVSIGYFQKARDINIEYCRANNIAIVRRPTGGRAILHDQEITYSLSTQTSSGIFSKGLLESYRKISQAFALAFTKIGLSPEIKLLRESHHQRSPLCFQSTSYGEVTVNNRKVIGSAQKRWSDGLLQQGSIPFLIDRDEMANVFGLEPSYTGGGMIGIKEMLPDITLEDFKNAIKDSFKETFAVRLIPFLPSPTELSLAEELESQRYLSPQWNFQR